jgi:hypothetical protein
MLFLRPPHSLLEFSGSFRWKMDSDHEFLPIPVLLVDQGPIAIVMNLEILPGGQTSLVDIFLVSVANCLTSLNGFNF